MEPLEINRYILSWLNLYPHPRATSAGWVSFKFAFAMHCVFMTALLLSGSIGFVYLHIIDDLERSLFGILQIAALTYVTYAQIVAQFLRPDIISAIDQIRKFHKSHQQSTEMVKLLDEGNKGSEKFTIIYCKVIAYIKSVAIGILILKIIVLSRTVGMDKYRNTSYQSAVPWNDQTALSKIFIAAFGMYTSTIYLFVNTAFITLFVGICKNCTAFFKQFQYLTQELNLKKPKKSLRYIIQYHQSAKEIYFQTSRLYSLIVWMAIACSIIHMSVAIFQLDLAITTNRKGSLLDYIMCLLASLSNLFLFCYFGKQATDSFGNMSEALYSSKWLEIEPQLRKYFVIMIGNAQMTLYYHGFNIMILDLESFTQVLKTVFSYYMMFKTFNE